MRPWLLDLFCCQGGAAKGYADAGFDVIGIDIEPQPRFPYPFVLGDAIEQGRQLLSTGRFSAVHASPPCQAHTLAQRIQNREHPDLIPATRQLLEESGLPYIIENVEGSPLLDPVMLCGGMFPQLAVYRHRLFESNIPLTVPAHPEHVAPLRKMGRRPEPGDFMHVVGNFSGVEQARAAMGGVDWMSRDGLRESIPPAYTEFLGIQLYAVVAERLRREVAA